MIKDFQTEEMRIAIVGHVDHGKSTVIGRLLADTGSLPDGKLEQVRETCRRHAKPFEYAFLLDALKDEQAQGITIDVARCFFKGPRRNYIIMDAPGHVEFIKNMVTGAAQADAALLVIDAEEGVKENSRRHGYLLSLLGVSQVIMLINKMDLVGYREADFKSLQTEYSAFLDQIRVHPLAFIPVSAREGDNIAFASKQMPWYRGMTVLERLEALESVPVPENLPFRLPVQGVYKFTRGGDNRRIVAGTVDAGALHVGYEVVFYPSGKRSRVRTIEVFPEGSVGKSETGYPTGFTLEEQIYVRRGDLAAKVGEPSPTVSTRMRVKLFWLGREPLVHGKPYLLKLGTAKVTVRVEEILAVLDVSNLERQEGVDRVDKHRVAECLLKSDKPLAFDRAEDCMATGRFVLVDDYDIAGGGIIEEGFEDRQSVLRANIARKNELWVRGEISAEERVERLNQKPAMILITGSVEANRKGLAKALERRLFLNGKFTYFLSMSNLLYGVDADIKNRSNNYKEEHMRRLAEVAHLMLDAGLILIVSIQELAEDDLNVFRTTLEAEEIIPVWLGQEVTTDLIPALHIRDHGVTDEAILRIKGYLQEQGFIFKAD